jgi:recombination protein RecR
METFCIQNLIQQFQKMPSIGSRTAERLAYYMVKSSKKEINTFVRAINAVKSNIHTCLECNNFCENDVCEICKDKKTRDLRTLCVVEQPYDIMSIEKTKTHKGLYHVLLGVLSPLDGIGPNDIKIGHLLKRLKDSKSKIKEVIIATNPNANGESTAAYLIKAIAPLKIKVSRIGFGVAVGSDLSYTDKSTLLRAFEARRSV